MNSASQLILGSVTYYQVVFTLPGDLSSLSLGNRKAGKHELSATDALTGLEHQDHSDGDTRHGKQPVVMTTPCGSPCSCGAPLILQGEIRKPS